MESQAMPDGDWWRSKRRLAVLQLLPFLAKIRAAALFGLRTLARQCVTVRSRPIADVAAFPERCMVFATPN